MVYLARYLDVFSSYIFSDNYFLKVVYILTSLSICVLIHSVYKDTYQRAFDTGLTEFTVFVAFGSAIFNNYQMTPFQVSIIKLINLLH